MLYIPPNTAFSVTTAGNKKVLYDHRYGKYYTTDINVPDQVFVKQIINSTKPAANNSKSNTNISKSTALSLANIKEHNVS